MFYSNLAASFVAIFHDPRQSDLRRAFHRSPCSRAPLQDWGTTGTYIVAGTSIDEAVLWVVCCGQVKLGGSLDKEGNPQHRLGDYFFWVDGFVFVFILFLKALIGGEVGCKDGPLLLTQLLSISNHFWSLAVMRCNDLTGNVLIIPRWPNISGYFRLVNYMSI